MNADDYQDAAKSTAMYEAAAPALTSNSRNMTSLRILLPMIEIGHQAEMAKKRIRGGEQPFPDDDTVRMNVLRTWGWQGGPVILYPLLGLIGETGELVSKMLDITEKDDIDENDLSGIESELGDIAWYLSETCRMLGLRLGDVLRSNVDKLASRRDRGVIHGDGDHR